MTSRSVCLVWRGRESSIDRVCSEAATVRIRQWTVGVARRLRRRSGGVARKHPIELGAGADAELEEHLAQVVLDRARADEQLGADLGSRESVVREPGDLGLLGGQVAAGLDAAFADCLARDRKSTRLNSSHGSISY